MTFEMVMVCFFIVFVVGVSAFCVGYRVGRYDAWQKRMGKW